MADPLLGATIAGCRIQAIAGRGGMGVVYRAQQLGLERTVAIKLIAPQLASDARFRERFKRETRAAAAIEHPNVIPVYDAGEADGRLYLIMRYVEGTDLRVMISRLGQLDPYRAAALLTPIAAALAAAHRSGLVHRDIKPANVLVAPGEDHEHPYLTDFGVARDTTASTGAGLTRVGAFVGTLDYMAPERMQGDRGDGRSDVYAFGCMLFEALAGRVPFPRDNDIARMHAHLYDRPPRASDVRPEVPEPIAAVAERAMAKRPEDRFQTAGELARALANAAGLGSLGGVTGDSRPTVRLTPMTPPDGETTVAAEVETAETGNATAVETAETGDATAQLERTREREVPGPPRGLAPGQLQSSAARRRAQRRNVVLAVLGVVVVAAIAAGAFVLLGGGDDEPAGQQAGGGGGQVNRVIAAAGSVAMPGEPDAVGAGTNLVWVTLADTSQVQAINVGNRARDGDPIPVGTDPNGVAVGEGAVWVGSPVDGTVSRVDPTSREVTATIQAGQGADGVAVGAGAVWVTDRRAGTLVRIDPDSNAVDGEPVPLGPRPVGVAFGAGAVWATSAGDGRVHRVDPESLEVTHIDVGGEPRGVAATDDGVWVTNAAQDLVQRIDPGSNEVAAEIRVGDNPRAVAAGDEFVWVTCHDSNELFRIDPQRDEVVGEPARTGPKPLGVAIADAAWVAEVGANRVTPYVLKRR